MLDKCLFLSLLLAGAAGSAPQWHAAELNQPLSFEVNQGQTDPAVRFVSRGGGYSLFLTADRAVLAFGGQKAASLTMRLAGANRAPRVTGIDRLPGASNYLTGADPAKWTVGVAHYAKVRYEQVYPGIDLVYYGNERELEHDFTVAPGADSGRIRMSFEGARNLRLDANGDLVLETVSGEVRHRKPVVYQDVAGQKKLIAGSYALYPRGEVGFKVASYDRAKPLIIDPAVLYFSTYLGGGGADLPARIAVDSQGNSYITGRTASADFPTKGALQSSRPGSLDVFVTKIDAARRTVVYSTYLGGSNDEVAAGIKVDASGNAYIAGTTRSADFPVTANAFQKKLGGRTDAFVAKLNAAGNALIYATYLGGSGVDVARGLDLDSATNAYVVGFTRSTDFPVTPNSFGLKPGGDMDGFVTKLNTTGTALVYSAYLGGRGVDMAKAVVVSSSGQAYVTGGTRSNNFPVTDGAKHGALLGGADAFIVQVHQTGDFLVYGSYMGGSKDDSGEAITIDPNDETSLYVAGVTNSIDFHKNDTVPSQPRTGRMTAFLVNYLLPRAAGALALTPDGVDHVDPGPDEHILDPDLFPPLPDDPLDPFPLPDPPDPFPDFDEDPFDGLSEPPPFDPGDLPFPSIDDGTVTIMDTGGTAGGRLSPDSGPNQATPRLLLIAGHMSRVSRPPGSSAPVVTRQVALSALNLVDLKPAEAPKFPAGAAGKNTWLRGLAVDSAGAIHVVVATRDATLPVSPQGSPFGNGPLHAYIARFSDNPPPPPPPPAPAPDLPKVTAVTNGGGFTAGAPVAAGSIASLFGTLLASGTATAAATPLPTTLAGTSVSVSGRPAPLFFASPTQINVQVPWETQPGPATAVVAVGSTVSAAFSFTVAPASPGIFTFGSNHAVAQHQDFSINNTNNPALAGSFIVVYLTGGGAVDNAVTTGAPNPSAPLSRVVASASATIGGQTADILFLGLAPGFVGLLQANLKVPQLSAGDYPVVITIGGARSNSPLITVSGS